MDLPKPTGALAGLDPLEPAHLHAYKAAVTAGQQSGWGYYFLYLLAKCRPGRDAILLGPDDGALCVYHWQNGESGPRLDLEFPPLPFDPSALGRALERANDFNGDRSARVMRIDEKDAGAVAAVGGLRLRQRRTQYVFAPGDYVDLGGRRYRTLRRQVALVEDRPDLEVRPFSAERAPECLALLRNWRAEHRRAHGTAGGAGTTRRAIGLAARLGDPDLRGELIYLDGRLVAFSLGGEIRPGVACYFDAKSDGGIPGLSYAQRRSFLLRMRDFEFVNDGSDTGRDGLRQLKDSFRPVAMHPEFRASQRRVSSSAG